MAKYLRYEFWPMWVFYAPFVPYWIWKSIKSGSPAYFCNANPGIEYGGFLDYSKYKILKQIPKEFIPKTQFIHDKIQTNPLPEFPFVAKPDLGERGVNVEIIRDKNDWKNYPLTKDIIIQEFIDLPCEFGIFYAKLPNEKSGKILSVTGKEFLTFEGDGMTSLKTFIENNWRANSRKKYLFEKFENQLNSVPSKGVKILLEPVGNHNRGTLFYDASDHISDNLTKRIDEISSKINGFYYGRFDVKSQSAEALQRGEFIILEVNGANSEPTHIYDPRYSIIKAYKEVKKHLDVQFKIAKSNPKNHLDINFFKAILKRI